MSQSGPCQPEEFPHPRPADPPGQAVSTISRLWLALGLSLCLLASGCGFFSSSATHTGGKHGTQKPYSVGGKTYYPVDSAKGWNETGTASWYGPDFHGHATSCGEIYDQYKMTCAHKILPMHTMLRVKNLQNGKEIVVRVNDRGPFVSGRIIDLTKAGAKELGMLGKGTAPVRVSVEGDIPGAEKGLPGPFYVQVGAFSLKVNADNLLGRMVRRGFAGSILNNANVGGDTFWRVHAGTFPTYEDAKKALERLKVEFPDAFVIAG